MTAEMKDRYDAKKACELPTINFGRVARSMQFYTQLFTSQHPANLYKKIKSEGKGYVSLSLSLLLLDFCRPCS